MAKNSIPGWDGTKYTYQTVFMLGFMWNLFLVYIFTFVAWIILMFVIHK